MHFVRPPAGALVLAVAGSRCELIVPFLYKTYSNTPFTIGSMGEPTRGMGFCFAGNVRNRGKLKNQPVGVGRLGEGLDWPDNRQ
jgi:hypothetical protein